MCTILRADKVSEQQSCSAIRASIASVDTSTGQTADRGTTYLWPSGNRTLVGGSDEDFSVNGNLAMPSPSNELGLCLKVEKTGNTFCYKEGARPKVAIPAQPAVSQAVLAGDPRSCNQLWNDRNSIFKASGLCFQAERAVKHFGNEGCRTPDIAAEILHPDGSRKRHVTDSNGRIRIPSPPGSFFKMVSVQRNALPSAVASIAEKAGETTHA
jgi:hypothetical protein